MSVEVRSVSHEYTEREIRLMGVTSKYVLGMVTQLLINALLGAYKRTRIKVLDNINLKVRSGEFIGVLGVNGSGKTTLLKIIGGLLKPTKGDVLINGYSIIRDEMIARRHVMYIPGSLVGGVILSPWLSIRDNLKKVFELYNAPMSKIDEALKVAGLEKYAHRRVGSLSSGLAARVTLISALYSNASVLLFDEPTAGISVEGVRSIHEFIKEKLWRENGATIIYATNNVNEAQKLCRKIVILHRGKIITSGSLHEIVNKMGLKETIKVKAYIHDIDKVKNTLAELGERYEVKSLGDNYYDIKVITSSAESILPELLESLIKRGSKILLVKVEDLSLEDVFMYYIREG